MAYGTGTHSHLRSTEFRQLKRERQVATREYEQRQAAGLTTQQDVGPFCVCAQYRGPHQPHGQETANQVARVYEANARRKQA